MMASTAAPRRKSLRTPSCSSPRRLLRDVLRGRLVASEILGSALTSASLSLCGVPYTPPTSISPSCCAPPESRPLRPDGNPATAKGIVQREVTGIVTPGTGPDRSMLDAARPNYRRPAPSRPALRLRHARSLHRRFLDGGIRRSRRALDDLARNPRRSHPPRIPPRRRTLPRGLNATAPSRSPPRRLDFRSRHGRRRPLPPLRRAVARRFGGEGRPRRRRRRGALLYY